MKLLCFPFSGATNYSYRPFQDHLEKSIEMVAYELPGRGRRFSEPLLENIHDMADDLFHHTESIVQNEPYAIYGHSLGTTLGHLFTLKIIEQKLPRPAALIFSGRSALSVPSSHPDRHKLSRKDFVVELKRLGGCPDEVLENEELMDLFEPVLRADFKSIELYEYERAPKYDIPLTILIGEQDEDTCFPDAEKWQEVTSRKIRVREFSGDHFFIFDQAAEICREIEAALHNEKNRPSDRTEKVETTACA